MDAAEISIARQTPAISPVPPLIDLIDRRRLPLGIDRLGRGIIADIRARAPFYKCDWTDAWHYRVVPATALIFFAK